MYHGDWPTRSPAPSDTRIFEAFLDLFVNYASGGSEQADGIYSEPVRRALKYMRGKMDAGEFEEISLAVLTSAAPVTPKHLCRIFQKELGISPMRACRLMQFQLAMPLLARSNLSIKAIGYRCGFSDPLYFSRSFSQTFGSSPSQIRDRLREGHPPPSNPLPLAIMPRLHW